jgi:hypothetical protein
MVQLSDKCDLVIRRVARGGLLHELLNEAQRIGPNRDASIIRTAHFPHATAART